ncbi:MAG: hypothetical protein OXP70_16550 [Acidobacteriota bacterium]|nr:hypothetical protein [Acidobacteriota bacterium]
MALAPSRGLSRVQACLAESGALADSLASGGSGFPEAVRSWLERLESGARETDLGVAPRLAGLRVSVEAAREGVIAPELELHGRLTPRKLRKATAQFALRSAIELVSHALQPFHARQLRAEDIALELAARSFEKALWPGQGRGREAPADMPSMWRAMLADPALASRVRELSALLGVPGGMMMVARMMNEYAGNSSGATGETGV